MGKSRGKFHWYEQSQRNKQSVEKANVLMSNKENNKSIEEKINSVFEEWVEKNRKILFSILDVILPLGRRNISLRGLYGVKIRKDMGKYFNILLIQF